MVEKILEICKVKPPLGSPTGICLPLTFFDLAWLRVSPSEILLFYESHFTETHFSNYVLPKLKTSLSLTLKYFLPVAGNILWPSHSHKFVVRYSKGDGVLLTAAVSDADFHHLSSKNIRECRKFIPFIAHIVGSRSQVPPIAVKVTLFPNKGLCIGMTFHHGVFDGKSMALFVKSWAWFSKFGENKYDLDPELIPNFERKFVREQYMDIEDSYIEFLKQNGVSQYVLSIGDPELPPDMVRGTFKLSGLYVKKLKELALIHLAKYEGKNVSQVPNVSTFAVIYAYVVHCLVKVKESTINRLVVAFPFDCRDLLEPPLPANYFGTCIGRFVIYFDREELLENDKKSLFFELISKIKKALDDRRLTGPKEWLSSLFEAGFYSSTTKIYVAGSPRFGFENIDFGWGKLRKLYGANDGSGGIRFSNVDGGGVEVEISLISHEMEIFASAFAQGLKTIISHGSAAL